MPPKQLFPGAMCRKGINTENSVIRGSILKEQEPPFWISVNLSDTFQTLMKQDKQSFRVAISKRENRGGPTNCFSCGVFDNDWYELQLKYWSLCFGFCKIQVPNHTWRHLWIKEIKHISCCNDWKIRDKKVVKIIFTFPLIMKIKEIF